MSDSRPVHYEVNTPAGKTQLHGVSTDREAIEAAREYAHKRGYGPNLLIHVFHPADTKAGLEREKLGSIRTHV